MGSPPQAVQHPLEDHQEALAPRVHHAGLFQHRVLVDGVGQGFLPLPNGGLQHGLRRVLLPGGGGGGLSGSQAGHGEDGALGGLHHRLVGGGHAEVQGDGQIPTVDGLPVLEGLCNSAEQQGERMTPEFPRAPEAGRWPLSGPLLPTVAHCFFFSSAAAALMVRLILVPVSPSGTGNTFRSLMCCFWALMAAAAWMTIC